MRHMSKSECWAVKSDNSGDGSWYSSCNVHALLCLLRSGWCASELDNMQRWSFSSEVEHFFFTVTFAYITNAHFLFIIKIFFCTSGGVRVRMRVVKGSILSMFRSETFLSLAECWTSAFNRTLCFRSLLEPTFCWTLCMFVRGQNKAADELVSPGGTMSHHLTGRGHIWTHVYCKVEQAKRVEHWDLFSFVDVLVEYVPVRKRWWTLHKATETLKNSINHYIFTFF